MEQKAKRFIVTCGGTGGHVFPGLAVANELKKRGHAVQVWLSGRNIESSTLGDWDGETFSTGAKKISVRTMPQLLFSLWRCIRQIRKWKPDAILAMGSYSSLPPVLAARFSGIRVVLHEANAVPGKAVEFLSRFASCVAYSFKTTERYFPNRKTIYTGLPVRLKLLEEKPYEGIPEGAFVIFITGGSQGAKAVNRLTSQAVMLLNKDYPNRIYVLHQCGQADEESLKQYYAEHKIPGRVQAFFPDIGRAMASANLIIARAGASTCFELALLGKPSLLIPLPSAIRDHQHLNAQALAATGGADEGIQAELTGRSIMRYLANKMKKPMELQQMSLAIRSAAMPDAAARVADILENDK